MPRRPPPRNIPPRPTRSAASTSPINSTTLAILGGVFILGIGVGVAFSKTTTLTPENVASTQFIDQSAPNPELCVQYGASAIVVDSRVFVTFNPFNVFVSQPVMQPGCVVRANNIGLLEQRKLITGEQLRECRQRLNTFGFTGTLENSPKINCIYQSNGDQNLFLGTPGFGNNPAETDNF